jgi:hypothetical protein
MVQGRTRLEFPVEGVRCSAECLIRLCGGMGSAAIFGKIKINILALAGVWHNGTGRNIFPVMDICSTDASCVQRAAARILLLMNLYGTISIALNVVIPTRVPSRNLSVLSAGLRQLRRRRHLFRVNYFWLRINPGGHPFSE